MDSEKIRDVIVNLLINAMEAVEPLTGKIIVCTELDGLNHQIILRVSDNGPGIEDTNIIFEPFHSTKGSAGAGLGLTIARQIIQKHGGTLNAQSRLNEGATFTVCIPIHTSG
jgi:signal transduction histidine kinase